MVMMARISGVRVAMEIRTFQGTECWSFRRSAAQKLASKAYAASVPAGLGHAGRLRPFEGRCVGVVGGRPQECRTAGSAYRAGAHGGAASVAEVFRGARTMVRHNAAGVPALLPAIITHEEPLQALIIDHTSYPKKGKHSVGVT